MPNRYQLFHYFDEQGNPKPFLLFWLTCFFATRSWLLFTIAGVSGEQGGLLLTLFYPNKTLLYSAFAISFPVLLLMFLAGSLHKLPRFFTRIWQKGKYIMLAVLGLDLLFQIKMLMLSYWQFRFAKACILVCTLWCLIYIVRSQRLAWFFRSKEE